MGFTAAGISHLTTTSESAAGVDDASQLAPLGFELTVPDGDNGNQVWIYVKNANTADWNCDTGTPTDKGLVIARVAESSSYQGIICPVGVGGETTARLIGVVQHTIGRNGYGFILRKGVGTIFVETGVSATAGLQIGTVSPGRVDAASAAMTGATLGLSLAAILTGEQGLAFINCPG